MKMILGTEFVFELDTLLFDKRQRSTAQKISEHDLIGQRNILQHLGPGKDEITLPGTIYPCQFGDPESLDELRDLADQGGSHTLIDDQGRIQGKWMIEGVAETATYFDNHSKPKKIQFSVKLIRQGG